MELILAIGLVTVLLIVPIKIAASMVGAENTGIGYCFLAILFSAILQFVVNIFVPSQSEVLGLLIALPLTAICYAYVLGTTFLKGIGIAIIQFVVTLLVVLVMALAVSGF